MPPAARGRLLPGADRVRARPAAGGKRSVRPRRAEFACAAYLCPLAVRCWRASEIPSPGGLFVTTLINPKAAFLALTFAPSSGLVILNLVGVGSALLAGALWLVLA